MSFVLFALLAAQSATPSSAAPKSPPTAPAAQSAETEASLPTGFPGTPVGHRPRVEIPWNRFYDDAEIHALMERLEAAYPQFLRHEVIGKSIEGREMRVYTLTDAKSGKDTEKPAMWIDGNVHGNEVQGGEAVVYVAWYVLENYGTNPEITELVDRSALYLLPMVNPDGRAHWFHDAHDANSSRGGYQPVDDDQDGAFDEDGPDDLDGNGQITQMRKRMPGAGTHRQDPDDPRVMVPVPPNDKGIKGDWILLGEEGIDNDGDGRVNEDEPGGYDMNRAWPSLWKPPHVQYGAGPYPLYWPETRSIARFVLEHPNIAALQSFHNSGGMILRGPGAEVFGEYEPADLRVFDELGKNGEKMLPFYRYMIIWKDLYSVFGGFPTWTYEGLGIISFTNEMWSDRESYPDEPEPEQRRGFGPAVMKERLFFDDTLLSGAGYVEWHAYDHPLYGPIEIGGFRKDVGRVPPTFLIEGMVHRNALFCLEHARAMPLVTIEEIEVTDLRDGVKAIDAVFRNHRLIPTRTAQAAKQKIGEPDAYTCTGRKVEVLAGGFRTDRWRPSEMKLAERDPARLLREDGIPGRGEVRVRWFVRGQATDVVLGFESDKARSVSVTVKLP